jgi:hypothetical protein
LSEQVSSVRDVPGFAFSSSAFGRRCRGRRAHAPAFDSPQQEAFLSLWRTYDRLRALEDELFARHELTAQQYNALRLLRAAHPQRVPTLSLAGGSSSRAPDITRLLDKLADRGLSTARGRRQPAGRARRASRPPAPRCSTTWRPRSARATPGSSRTSSAAELRTLTDLLRKARGPHEPEGSGWR